MGEIRHGVLAATISFLCLTPVGAQDTRDDFFRRQTQALAAIKEMADSICPTAIQEGRMAQGTLSGNVQARLDTTISTVKELKLSGAGDVKTIEYRGVVQEALASTLHDEKACKRSVFERLVVIMVPTIKETGLPITQSVRLTPRRPENNPSISCSRITEPLEKLLCEDDDLAKWDGRMGQLYWSKMGQLTSADRQMLKQQQLNWISRRNAACRYNPRGSYTLADLTPAKPCILQMTRQRVTELE
ncbi:MAG TPA: lysozyme inhibitor LprI family protein [Blastocatellia bacterium]|nr:lysozyme inhibitor LprI family protein [Blastocatellia bacterium]